MVPDLVWAPVDFKNSWRVSRPHRTHSRSSHPQGLRHRCRALQRHFRSISFENTTKRTHRQQGLFASVLKLSTPTYGDLNHRLGDNVRCDHLSSLPRSAKCRLRKLAVNMVPFHVFIFHARFCPWRPETANHTVLSPSQSSLNNSSTPRIWWPLVIVTDGKFYQKKFSRIKWQKFRTGFEFSSIKILKTTFLFLFFENLSQSKPFFNMRN